MLRQDIIREKNVLILINVYLIYLSLIFCNRIFVLVEIVEVFE